MNSELTEVYTEMYQFHETYNKIILNNPKIFTIEIILLFSFIILISVKRHQNENLLLDRNQTDQLKGIAIILIIIGHFAWHAIDNMYKLSLFVHWGYICVGIFLMLSAFGLHRSSIKHGFKNFFRKRIKRVYLPYLTITVVWFFIDFCLLNRAYKFTDYLLMALGINDFGNATIDGNLWYITYLLFWYLLFFIIFKFFYKLNDNMKVIFCFLSSFFVLYVGSRYILPNTWGINAFDFPIGVLISIYFDKITEYLKKLKKSQLISFVILFALGYLINKYFKAKITSVFLQYLFNSASSVFLELSIALIVYIIYINRVYSKFLIFAGSISYELYLLHGPLMYRYDFIIWRGNPIITFPIYLIFIFLLSWLFSKFIKCIEKNLNFNRYGE
jgi:peptidoglycan/LPS O-acetylase OafA/YrhL